MNKCDPEKVKSMVGMAVEIVGITHMVGMGKILEAEVTDDGFPLFKIAFDNGQVFDFKWMPADKQPTEPLPIDDYLKGSE